MDKSRHNKFVSFILLTLMVAIAYGIAARLSLTVATLPNGISSVWLPSGITFGLVYLLGDRVLLGIALGSIWGVSTDLLVREPNISIATFLILNCACILGNILQPLAATYILKKYTVDRDIFHHVPSVMVYITAAITAPVISALIGIGSMILTAHMSPNKIPISLFTWWLASTLAHLNFTPAILLWREFYQQYHKYHFTELALTLILSILLSFGVFIQSYPLAYLLLPLLLWTVFRYGSFLSSLVVCIVSMLAIFFTAREHGLFVEDSQNTSLLLLQSFMGVFALTSLLLSAVVEEKKQVQLELKQALDHSEQLVIERTAELKKSEDLLRQANLELKKQINIDGLTQIANRRCFDERITMEWHRLCREQQPLSLLLFDVDFFKNYNDFYGHQLGDECLTKIAQSIKNNLHRPADLIARYGGEEFCIILPNTDEAGAKLVAEQMRITVSNLKIPHETSLVSNVVTISVGVACLFPNVLQDVSFLINQADQALYAAKKHGRNCIFYYPD